MWRVCGSWEKPIPAPLLNIASERQILTRHTELKFAFIFFKDGE